LWARMTASRSRARRRTSLDHSSSVSGIISVMLTGPSPLDRPATLSSRRRSYHTSARFSPSSRKPSIKLPCTVNASQPSDASTSDATVRFRHEVLAAVFQVREKRLYSLLWRRAKPPFEGDWAFRRAARTGRTPRLVTRSTSRDQGRPDRYRLPRTAGDPQRCRPRSRERTIATAYLALVSSALTPSIRVTRPGSMSMNCPDGLRPRLHHPKRARAPTSETHLHQRRIRTGTRDI